MNGVFDTMLGTNDVVDDVRQNLSILRRRKEQGTHE